MSDVADRTRSIAAPDGEPPLQDRAVEAPGLGPLADSLGFHLRLAQEASFAAFAGRVAASDPDAAGLRPGRYAVLALIDRNPGLTQTALGQASGRDKSTLTPVLNDLALRGLVRRDRTAGDKRSYALTLTEAGQSALRRLSACAGEHERELDRLVGPEARPVLMAALRRIAAHLGEQNGSEDR